jgi:diguanylate cyclase (GGDEF)-like protein
LNWLDELVASDLSLEEKLQDFCRKIASTYGYEVVLIHLKDRDGFIAHAGLGVDLNEISEEVIQHDSRLVEDLKAAEGTVDLSTKNYASFDLKTLVARYAVREAYPLGSDGSVEGIMFLGSSTFGYSNSKQESILSLCRLVGQHLFGGGDDLEAGVSSTLIDTASVSPGLAGIPGRSQYFDIVSKLHKIYNEDLLFETFSLSLKTLFNPAFCFLCLPNEESSRLSVDIRYGSGAKELRGHAIEGKSAAFDLLVRRPDAYPVESLLDLTGNDTDIKFLHKHGTELITPIRVSEKRIGLLGMSKPHGDDTGYTAGDREMIFALCQTVEIVLENIQQFKKIEELSYTDSMTRLYNYRYFYKRLNEEILRARRFNRHLALAIFDLDDFKVFNDSFGHQAGDYLLRQLGALLVGSVRTIDIVCRYGGEEFCVIMPESDEESCSGFMERLRLKVANHQFRSRFSNEIQTITVSAGGGIFPADARRCDRLIYCADMALLEAKRAGKNACRMFNQLRSQSDQPGTE